MNQMFLSKLFMKLLMGIPLLLLWTNGMAQHPVSGTVVDGSSNEPLPGVTVVVMGTNQGTATNVDGRFELTAPDDQSVLVFTYIGYTRIEVPIEGRSDIEIELQQSVLLGDDIVVVGYGTQRAQSLTGSIASVSSEQMAKIPVPTVTHALQGMAPGLQLLDGGDRPGRNQLNLLIRGQGTLGRGNPGSAAASRPLVLVDGIESNLANVDVNDVERISVLKDASSAAIYGSRAANGVILVTTKRGSAQGRVQITYDGYFGMQDITAWPKQVDAETHMRLANVARTNFLNWCLDGRDPSAQTEAACHDNPSYAPRYTEEYIQNTIAGTDRDAFPADDHVDAMFNPAPIRDQTLRISGGNETARYALSLNHMGEDGLMPNTGANRTGVRLNTDFQLSEQISGGVDLSATRRWDTIPAENWGSTFFLIHDTPPTIRTRYSDGTYGLNLFGHSPLAYAEESGSEDRVFWDGTATGRLNYQIIPGWAEIQTLVSFDYGNMDWQRFRTDPSLIDSYPSNGTNWGPSFGENRSYTSNQRTLRALVDYGHMFDEIHEISGVVGYEQIEYDFEEFRAWRDQFYNNELRQLDLGNTANAGTRGYGEQWALHSGFTRFNYTLMDRYMFEFNARYDGSSRFAEGHRYGFFPSFSLGWRLNEESFFNVDWVNELKFRGSWGKLGNQDVPLYSYYSSINLNIPYFMGNTGGTQATGGASTNLINEELSWETTTVVNLGVDAMFLADRLSFTGEIYTRRTEDILLQLPVPDMVGLGAAYQNAGVVENKGWELSLGWQDAVGDFSYGINLNLSDNRNEVVDLYGTGPYILGGGLGGNVVQEGSPIGSWYGLEAEGLFNSYEQIDAHAQVAGWETRLGDIIYKDQNGDGIINDEDRVVIGDPNPRYIYGVNLNMGWKNFDFSAFVQGVGKRDQYLGLGFAQGPVWENFTSEWHKDHWTPDNPGARHPAYYSNYNRNYYTTNSWWILDGSFMKLRNLQVGYTLPQDLIGQLGIQNVRVYATGKNLWTRHKLGLDLDPEYPWTVGDYYPQTRVVSLGANISF